MHSTWGRDGVEPAVHNSQTVDLEGGGRPAGCACPTLKINKTKIRDFPEFDDRDCTRSGSVARFSY